MAKIIFFAFVALVCAQQIQADGISFSDLQNIAVKHIDAIAEEINKDVAKAQKIVDQTVTDIKKKVEGGLSDVESEFRDATTNIKNAVSDVKKVCNVAYTALVRSHTNLINRTNKCIDNHIQGAYEHLKKIVNFANNVLKQLNLIRDRAITACSSKNMDLAKVSLCYGKCTMDSTYLLAKHAPFATLETAKLSASVATLGPKIIYCTAVQSLTSDVYNDFMSNLGKVKVCLL